MINDLRFAHKNVFSDCVFIIAAKKWRKLLNFCRQITRRKLAPDVSLFSTILPALCGFIAAGQERAAPGNGTAGRGPLIKEGPASCY